MVMLMFDHVRRGKMAKRRGVLMMEIRGKHGCVLASGSTTIPPLDGRRGASMVVGSKRESGSGTVCDGRWQRRRTASEAE